MRRSSASSRRGSSSSSGGGGGGGRRGSASSMDLDAAAARAAPVQSADHHHHGHGHGHGHPRAHEETLRSALSSSISRHDALLGSDAGARGGLPIVAEEGGREGRAPALKPVGGGGGSGRGLAEVHIMGGGDNDYDEATVMAVGQPERREAHRSHAGGGGGASVGGSVPSRVSASSTDSSAVTALMSNTTGAGAGAGAGGGRRTVPSPPRRASGGGGGRGRGGVMRRGVSVGHVLQGGGGGGGPRRGAGAPPPGGRRGSASRPGAASVAASRGSSGDHKTIYSAPGVMNRNLAGAELPQPMAAPSNPQGVPNGGFEDGPHVPPSSAAAAIAMAANRKTPSERSSSSQHGGDQAEGSVASSGRRRESFTLTTEPLPRHGRLSARRIFHLGGGGKPGALRERAYGVGVAALCFVVSLVVAALYGQGRLGRGAGGLVYKGLRPEGGAEAAAGAASAPDVPDLAAMDIELPAAVDRNYADTTLPFPKGTREQMALFWEIPRSGGNAVIKAVLGQCRGLVEASDLAADKSKDGSLKIYETAQGTRFVNVDPTTPEGIRRGVALRLASAGIADVAFTPLIRRASAMFGPDHPGRIFAVFRHPVDRAASRFRRDRTTDPSLADMTLAEYARAGRAGGDWMTRALAGKERDAGAAATEEEELTEDDLLLALEVLRRKVLVGLADRMEESLGRFEAYFGWDGLGAAASGAGGDVSAAEAAAECRRGMLAEAAEAGPAVEEGSEGWDLLMERNAFDARVYEYARYLYSVQGTRL